LTDQVVDGIKALLRGLGVSDAEIDEAASQGIQALVVLLTDRAIIPGTERLTRSEVAERAGVSLDDSIAFWRALGFADVPDDDRAFTEVDVDALQLVAQVLSSGMVDRELALQTTRVLGRSVAQIASALIDTVRRTLDEDYDGPPPAMLTTPALIEDVERWLVYVFRRHLVAEAKRATMAASSGDAGSAVVGFGDMVGFTGISQSLDAKELAKAVATFEETAVDLVGRHSARIVKMIGDEVMFEAPTARDGAEIALDLVDAFVTDDLLPDVRVGLALGTATRHQGDLFGEAPNLASRLVDEAYPNTVLVSDSVHDLLEDVPEFNFRPVRARMLKGFGRTKYWVLRREGHEEERQKWKIPTVFGELIEELRESGSST
jgi:adenylate cyclase